MKTKHKINCIIYLILFFPSALPPPRSLLLARPFAAEARR